MEIKEIITEKYNSNIVGIIPGTDIDYIINKICKDKVIIKSTYNFKTKKVYDEIKEALEEINYNQKLIDKKIKDALLIVKLENKLNYSIDNLSDGEKVLLQVAIKLSLNPKTLVIDDIFYYLDKNYRNILTKLLKMLNEKYKRNIYIVSNNIDFIYNLATEFIIIKDKKILIEGNKKIFYKDYDLLIQNKLELPKVVFFIKKVLNDKNIKLHERDNIKDLMKDIYRSLE